MSAGLTAFRIIARTTFQKSVRGAKRDFSQRPWLQSIGERQILAEARERNLRRFGETGCRCCSPPEALGKKRDRGENSDRFGERGQDVSGPPRCPSEEREVRHSASHGGNGVAPARTTAAYKRDGSGSRRISRAPQRPPSRAGICAWPFSAWQRSVGWTAASGETAVKVEPPRSSTVGQLKLCTHGTPTAWMPLRRSRSSGWLGHFRRSPGGLALRPRRPQPFRNIYL
ncbi:uncharacterized protein LOC144123876 [Amblyomma americanum]